MPHDSGSLSGESVPYITASATRQVSEPSHALRRRADVDLQMRLPRLLRAADWFGIVAIGFLIDLPFEWHVRPLTHTLGIVLAATITVNYLQIACAYSVCSVQH